MAKGTELLDDDVLNIKTETYFADATSGHPKQLILRI